MCQDLCLNPPAPVEKARHGVQVYDSNIQVAKVGGIVPSQPGEQKGLGWGWGNRGLSGESRAILPRPAVLCHLQDLIPFLDALPVGRAACLHPGYEDAHVVAAGQPQTNTRALGEAHHTSVGAVAAREGGAIRPEVEGTLTPYRTWFSKQSR